MNYHISYNWLKEYTPLPEDFRSVATQLAQSGPSVERIIEKDGDVLFDVEITTNRIDAFSTRGFAREAAAILGLDFKDPFSASLPEYPEAKEISVLIEKGTACRRYMAAHIKGVSMKPTPDWIVRRLEDRGVQSINVVVDITNYVMLEVGQPMHAFDAHELATDGTIDIVVRNAIKGEKITTLSGEEKELNPTMTVIADHTGPLAIAGVKGGKRGGITPTTTEIIFESASFNPVSVRRSARDCDLRTDASLRYEKDLSPEYSSYALARAIELAQELCGGEVVGVVDVYPEKEVVKQYPLQWKTISRILGIALPEQEVIAVLERLGFTTKKIEGGLNVTVPFWRSADIEGERDLVEEVGRLHGYHRIPLEPIRGSLSLEPIDYIFATERQTKNILKGLGWTEAMHYSLTSTALREKAGDTVQAIEVQNPLSAEYAVLRTSLIPSLVVTASEHEQKRDELSLFEWGKIYIPTSTDELPSERAMLGGIYMTLRPSDEIFAKIKGDLTVLLKEWCGPAASRIEYKKGAYAAQFDEENAAILVVDGKNIGGIGILSPKTQEAFGIKKNAGIFVFDIETFRQFFSQEKSYTSIPKFPAVLRDVSLLVPREIPYTDLVAAIRAASTSLHEVELFDRYAGKGIPENAHSLSFHLSYQSTDRTLTAEEVDTEHESVRNALLAKGATIR